jgi:2-oxoglutarate ferredoxin oxidoreductase subunit alpha
MVEKRARKFQYVAQDVPVPQLEGPADADITLIGFGSTYGVIKEAIEMLTKAGIRANHLPIKWIVPFHADTVSEILNNAKRRIIVENNYSGQFARYLRSETGIAAHGHIRKYDGEPFLPHHIVEAVQEQLAGKTDRSVPVQEFIV